MATLVREPDAAPRAVTRDRRLVDAAVVAGPAALAILLCLISLTSRSLWLDEAATVAIAGQHGSALWSAIAHDGGNMLGYYALLHVVIGWFGELHPKILAAFDLKLPVAAFEINLDAIPEPKTKGKGRALFSPSPYQAIARDKSGIACRCCSR